MNLININTTLTGGGGAGLERKGKKINSFYISVAQRTHSKRHCCRKAAFARTGFNRKGLCCRLASTAACGEGHLLC